MTAIKMNQNCVNEIQIFFKNRTNIYCAKATDSEMSNNVISTDNVK